MLHNLNNESEANDAFQFITTEAARGSTVEIKVVKPHNQRTLRQNAALHLMYTQLADQLNDTGNDMRKVLKEGVDIPWSSDTVKDLLWRPIMEAQTGKVSTTQLTTKDIDAVFVTLIRHLGTKLGIELEWPSIDTLLNGRR